MKLILFLFIFSFNVLASSSSIFVEVGNNTIKVTTPEKMTKSISLHIENQTNHNYFMKLENKNEVIKLFTLNAKKTYSLDFNSSKDGLKITPLSPAFRDIPLNKVNKTYEISKI